jgi:hypothetical protein
VLEAAVDLFHFLILVKLQVDLEDCFLFMTLLPTAFFPSKPRLCKDYCYHPQKYRLEQRKERIKREITVIVS